MTLDEFKRMRRLGERKLTDEANLRDLSEVHVVDLERGGERFELDEHNRRFRRLDPGTRSLGPWEELER